MKVSLAALRELKLSYYRTVRGGCLLLQSIDLPPETRVSLEPASRPSVPPPEDSSDTLALLTSTISRLANRGNIFGSGKPYLRIALRSMHGMFEFSAQGGGIGSTALVLPSTRDHLLAFCEGIPSQAVVMLGLSSTIKYHGSVQFGTELEVIRRFPRIHFLAFSDFDPKAISLFLYELKLANLEQSLPVQLKAVVLEPSAPFLFKPAQLAAFRARPDVNERRPENADGTPALLTKAWPELTQRQDELDGLYEVMRRIFSRRA